MAHNQTQSFLEILKSFHTGDLILAFCLSALVGSLLGAILYILLTWASRRRRAGRSRRSQIPLEPRPETEHNRSTFLGVYRRPSPEPPPVGKPVSRTSTFRSPTAAGNGAQPPSDSSDSVSDKRLSFWLGGYGLKGFLPSQTPPPTYNSVIGDDQEAMAREAGC
ncbi:myc target protein 1 homolog [Corythoichthys intestinalis]|uniref:myc target protein 1 homolog n=1 Tax=Corythoichthys intestinalis TaxID=161448 RepID=UPI0025A6466C|nr:myc target protein 1 homolog [Corythoichthys intestinalis]